MINLPKVTLLCGRWGQGQIPLTKLLCNEDDNLIRMDFTAHVHDAVAQLFPDVMPVTMDPMEVLDKSIGPGPARVQDLMENLVVALRSTFGSDALGRLAVTYLEQHDTFEMFARVIYTDCIDVEDARVIIDHVGSENVLAILLGDMTYIKGVGLSQLGCKSLWLPIPEAPKQLEYLRKELATKEATNDRLSYRDDDNSRH